MKCWLNWANSPCRLKGQSLGMSSSPTGCEGSTCMTSFSFPLAVPGANWAGPILHASVRLTDQQHAHTVGWERKHVTLVGYSRRSIVADEVVGVFQSSNGRTLRQTAADFFRLTPHHLRNVNIFMLLRITSFFYRFYLMIRKACWLAGCRVQIFKTSK